MVGVGWLIVVLVYIVGVGAGYLVAGVAGAGLAMMGLSVMLWLLNSLAEGNGMMSLIALVALCALALVVPFVFGIVSVEFGSGWGLDVIQ